MKSFVKSMKKGFTLIELLVVIAIIAILAAILFPVFASAKAASYKTVDISNFKQLGTATAMYTADNDGAYFLSNSGGNSMGWGFGPPDTVPGQQMMPYTKNTKIHICPMDTWKDENRRIADHARELGWNVATMTQDQRMYALMVRSNMGYNYAFLSPWRVVAGIPTSASVKEGEITSASETLLFGSAIWYRTPGSGQPEGGGNWVIETPCWEDANNRPLRPMSQYHNTTGDGTLRSYPSGWVTPTLVPNSSSWLVYGGLWPFHNQRPLENIQRGLKDGLVITAMADTSVKARNVRSLTEGCQAYGSGQFKGNVIDSSKFLWDLD
jgi:prepilin-type N-terminal cleavage/methylation domain-containing protein